jgi:hypothetical protein
MSLILIKYKQACVKKADGYGISGVAGQRTMIEVGRKPGMVYSLRKRSTTTAFALAWLKASALRYCA